jgi:hypothetical protein
VSLAANFALGFTGAAALGGAVAIGWLAPGEPQVQSLAVARHAQPADTAALERPGADLPRAVDQLAAQLPAAKPDPEQQPTMVVVRRPVRSPPPGPTVMAAAPMHDAGLVFRAQTAAIVRQGDHLAVLLAAGEGRPARLLKVGELFDDRWRLTALTMDEAVLGDGVSQERVPLFGNPAGAAGRVQ